MIRDSGDLDCSRCDCSQATGDFFLRTSSASPFSAVGAVSSRPAYAYLDVIASPGRAVLLLEGLCHHPADEAVYIHRQVLLANQSTSERRLMAKFSHLHGSGKSQSTRRMSIATQFLDKSRAGLLTSFPAECSFSCCAGVILGAPATELLHW